MLTVRAAAIAQGTLLFCAMGACAPAPRTIGVSIQNLHSEFYTAVENGIRNDAGNNAVDVRDAESDAEQQNEVEASIARNVRRNRDRAGRLYNDRERGTRSEYCEDSGLYGRH